MYDTISGHKRCRVRCLHKRAGTPAAHRRNQDCGIHDQC